MRTDGRKTLMYLGFAKAALRSGGVRRRRRRTDTPAPRGEMKSALVRVLPASLRTFLVSDPWVAAWASSRNRGGVTRNAIYDLEPCLAFRERDGERRNRRVMTQQRALHIPPAAARPPKLPGKAPSPAEVLSPGTEHGCGGCSGTARKPHSGGASEHTGCSLPPRRTTRSIFKKARCFTILTSDCRMRQWMTPSADVCSWH